MLPTFQSNAKSVVLSAWRERWPIKKWTLMARQMLINGNLSDMQHMAEILFSQAFVGSTPNTVLLNYFHYSLRTNIFTYSAVIAAISKHEDLQNIECKKCILTLLGTCITDLNKGQILEDCMALSRALLQLLKWLLRNMEQYLQGVAGISNQHCEEVVQISCATLQSLTQLPRTSALLTVARFEESSVWSHIETDLAVIKNAAGQRSLQADVARSCHCVSQLSRLNIRSQAVFTTNNNDSSSSDTVINLSVNMLILLKNDSNRYSDIDSMVSNIIMIARVCDVSISKILLDTIRICIMAYLDSSHTTTEQKWLAVLFLALPQYLLSIKNTLATLGNDELSTKLKKKDFENELVIALKNLVSFNGILHVIDIKSSKFGNSFDMILDKFVEFELVSLKSISIIKEAKSLTRNELPNDLEREDHGADPNRMIKAESTMKQLLKELDPNQFQANKEDLLSIFKSIVQTESSLNLYFSTAAANGSITDYTKKIIQLNNEVKASSAENSNSALSRSVLFDLTFFIVCHIAKENGKDTILNWGRFPANKDLPFLYQWIKVYWPNQRFSSDLPKHVKNITLPTDANRVEKLLLILQKGTEFDGQLKKWDDLCTNVPEALNEFVIAWQHGTVTDETIFRACAAINSGISLSVCMTCITYLVKKASKVSKNVLKTFYTPVIKKLYNPTSSGLGKEDHYRQRYNVFKNITKHLILTILPKFFNEDLCKPHFLSPRIPVIDKLQKCLEVTCNKKWISYKNLIEYDDILHLTGPKWFCHQLVEHILTQTRKDGVKQATNAVFSLFHLDIESLTVSLLCNEIPHYLTNEEKHLMLSEPAGMTLAEMAVACLSIVLHNLAYQQKGVATSNNSVRKLHQKQMVAKNANSVFLHQGKSLEEDRPLKLRRLLSSTAEHDLANSAFSSMLGDNVSDNQGFKQSSLQEPLLQALNHCLNVMHSSLIERRPGPHTNFIVQFINLCSQSDELIKQAIMQLMPISMVSELTTVLTSSNRVQHNTNINKDFNSLKFSLAISHLGHVNGRRIAAKSICQISL